MKRKIPLLICLLIGVAMVIQFLIPHPASRDFGSTVNKWYIVLAAFALVLAIGNLIRHHSGKIQKKKQGWPYSIVTLASMLVMSLIGFIGGVAPDSLYQSIYLHIMAPLGATMFALLAYFMASASYRAFRARSLEASLLLAAAFVVMIGFMPLGPYISPYLPAFAEWIMRVPNMASQRGILFGVAFGSIATALKIILGIERSWLGGKE